MNQQSSKFCSSCGNPVTPGAKFCSTCGAPLEHGGSEDTYRNASYTYSSDNGNTGHTSWDDFIQNFQYFFNQTRYIPNEAEEDLFIQENIPYYRNKFDTIRQLAQKTSWNWAAFFFGPIWTLYRKMYAVTIGIVCIQILMTLLGVAGGLLGLLLMLAMGMFGNYLYMCTIQSRVTKMHTLDVQAGQQYLNQYRGTSALGILVGVIVVATTILPWLLIVSVGTLGILGIFAWIF